MRSDRLRLLDAIEQVELISSLSERGREAFFNDVILQRAVLHRLALLGEACRGLSPDLREAHPEIPSAQIIGFRNVLIHESFGIDLELTWAIVAEHIPTLRAQLNSVVASFPVLIYLSLGANLADRDANLRMAIDALQAGGVLVSKTSPVYETEPVNYLDQSWFLNLVVEAETALSPRELLALIAKIERELGRVRDIPKGPRTIDIDILFYADAVIDTPDLQIPHPRIAERRFVLAPLADLAPAMRHPVTGRSVREMLENAPSAAVRLLHS